mmetsp:Transcript_14536/g.43932  ORF Transcript_14536/g.43932 Transcript_14536/m.43932 type:complete len:758 (-) Transcript_14536:985-3258(-)
MRRCQAVLLLALASWAMLAHAHVELSESAVAANAADLDFKRAMELRDQSDTGGSRNLREAAELLRAAAGVIVTLTGPASAKGMGSDVSQEGGTAGSRRTIHYEKEGSEAHLPALRELAKAYQLGQGVPQDADVAVQLMRYASDGGDPAAQADVAFRAALGLAPSSTGSWEFQNPDLPEALLHYYFAAAGRDTVAQMALGHRHAHGVGVPRSCQAAVLYYQPVAERAVELARHPSSLPEVPKLRLSARAAGGWRPSTEQDVLHYQWFADLGNVEAQRAVGQILLGAGAQRDPAAALRYFQQAADRGDAQAMASLGHMHANGRGVPPSNATALKWFLKAAELGQPSAQYGLGYMHLTGQGVPIDHRKAFKHFSLAAEQGNTEAWFHLGVMHLNGWGVPRNPGQAQYFFSMTAKTGHVLGMYNLAMMQLAKDPSNCASALDLLKKVAEKGPAGALLQGGRDAFEAGDYEGALLAYLRAAEAGFELGQSNAAWLLSHGYTGAARTAGSLPVALHQRAAQQGHLPSLLEVGDAFWYGRNTVPDWQRAGEVYGRCPMGQAYFNLGYMHQYGAGMQQDLHLAKRFYDKAAAAQPAAWLPVRAALLGLAAHSLLSSAPPHLAGPAALLRRHLFAPLHQPEADTAGQVAGSLRLRSASAAVGAALSAAGRLSGASAALAAGGARLSSAFSSGDGGETMVLLGLVVVLLAVLRRRRALRALYGPPPGPLQREMSRPLPPAAAAAAGAGKGAAGEAGVSSSSQGVSSS